MGKVEHKIYLDGELKMELENAALYDTLSPYRFVANSFYDLNQQLKSGSVLRIESNGQEHQIKSEEEFRQWILSIFNSPYNNGFEKYLNETISYPCY